MFTRISHSGIVMDNIRSLSLGLTVASIVVPLFRTELILIAIGVLMGGYYGYRIEKETHELSSLGGRVYKGKEWDYLVMV